MQKLNAEQVKELLRVYPMMPAQIKNLVTALENRSVSDAIYSGAIGQTALGATGAGNTSNKTQYVALDYENTLRREDDAIRRVLDSLRSVQAQIENALETLEKEDSEALVMLYSQRKAPVEVYENLNKKYCVYSENTRRRKVRIALDRLAAMLYISERDFENITKEGRP